MSKQFTTSHELSHKDLDEIDLHNNFSERSDIAHEIISRKPGFFEKWALLFFLILLLLLAATTWFIKYPEIIKADAVLTGTNAPKEIVTPQSGKLSALFVKNNQQVKQGEILGWIESNARTREVIDLANILDTSSKMVGRDQPQLIVALFKKQFTGLGELQTSYQTFITALQQYNDYLVNGFYSNKKTSLHSDIASLEQIKEKTSLQKDFTNSDNELAKKTFEMKEMLFKEKVISAEEYRQAQSTLLNKQKASPQIEANILSQQNQIRDKQKEIDQLNHDILQQQQTFEQALQTLKSDVDEWLRKYTLQAPADGTVVFILPVQQNQYLQQGKLLGYINPPDSKYFAEIKLSQNNFGKLDTGMKVQLRFDAYPYQEVGFISGTLNYISTVSVDSFFLGTVRLDNGLTTNHFRPIQYKNGLKAQALIITKDMRLLERIYYSIVKSTSIKK